MRLKMWRRGSICNKFLLLKAHVVHQKSVPLSLLRLLPPPPDRMRPTVDCPEHAARHVGDPQAISLQRPLSPWASGAETTLRDQHISGMSGQSDISSKSLRPQKPRNIRVGHLAHHPAKKLPNGFDASNPTSKLSSLTPPPFKELIRIKTKNGLDPGPKNRGRETVPG